MLSTREFEPRRRRFWFFHVSVLEIGPGIVLASAASEFALFREKRKSYHCARSKSGHDDERALLRGSGSAQHLNRPWLFTDDHVPILSIKQL